APRNYRFQNNNLPRSHTKNHEGTRTALLKASLSAFVKLRVASWENFFFLNLWRRSFARDRQAAWYAFRKLRRWRQTIQGLQKRDQIFLLQIGQIQLRHFCVLAEAVQPAPASAAVVIKFDDFFQSLERAIVHVGRGACDVAKARRFEHPDAVFFS